MTRKAYFLADALIVILMSVLVIGLFLSVMQEEAAYRKLKASQLKEEANFRVAP